MGVLYVRLALCLLLPAICVSEEWQGYPVVESREYKVRPAHRQPGRTSDRQGGYSSDSSRWGSSYRPRPRVPHRPRLPPSRPGRPTLPTRPGAPNYQRVRRGRGAGTIFFLAGGGGGKNVAMPSD